MARQASKIGPRPPEEFLKYNVQTAKLPILTGRSVGYEPLCPLWTYGEKKQILSKIKIEKFLVALKAGKSLATGQNDQFSP